MAEPGRGLKSTSTLTEVHVYTRCVATPRRGGHESAAVLGCADGDAAGRAASGAPRAPSSLAGPAVLGRVAVVPGAAGVGRPRRGAVGGPGGVAAAAGAAV